MKKHKNESCDCDPNVPHDCVCSYCRERWLKRKPKRTLVLQYESEDGLVGGTVRMDIAKAASIDSSGAQFLYVEKKHGREGFTLNWTRSLIPEGYRLKSITMEREDI